MNTGIARAGDGFRKPSLAVRAAAFLPWALANALVFPKVRTIFGKDIKFCVDGGALLELKQQEFFNAIGVPVYRGYGLTENAPIICSNSALRHKFDTSGVVLLTLEVKIMKGYFKNPQATAETIRAALRGMGLAK